MSDDHVELDRVLDNSGTTEFCAPLTSFDWNDVDVKRVGTCSIDTTCTVWDVERGVVDTQLIAHDREVYDMAWGGAGVFASVRCGARRGATGASVERCVLPSQKTDISNDLPLRLDRSADCSVRVFDLRDKEHSTIIYESPEPDSPLLHLAWNKQARGFTTQPVPSVIGPVVVCHTKQRPALPAGPPLHRRTGLRQPSCDRAGHPLPDAASCGAESACRGGQRAGVGSALVLPHVHGRGRQARCVAEEAVVAESFAGSAWADISWYRSRSPHLGLAPLGDWLRAR